MAQTISDLEKEREKILAAIDEHAKQFSAQRGNSNEASAHNLSDWLNAAEEVVTLSDEARGPKITADKANTIKHKPSSKKSKTPSKNLPPKSNAQAARSKASFFGVILMLCLLFTVIGVVYLAYISFDKEMKLIHQAQQENIEKFEALEAKLDKLSKDIEVGGDSEIFDALTSRLDELENSIAGLQHLDKHAANTQEFASQLDSLEKRVNLRITGLLKGNASAKTEAPAQETKQQSAELKIADPVAPTEPQAPVVEQQVVKLVESKDTADVAWLKNQKPNDLVLQLASVPSNKVKDLEGQIASKNIKGARIVPQKVSATQTNYVLVVGSFANRVDANKASLEIKKSTGMEAWVRPAKDLINRLN